MDKENRDVLNKWLADKTGPTPCYTDEHIELLWEEILQLRYERAEAGKRAMAAESQIQALREALRECAEAFNAAAEGQGINFYQYGKDAEALLKEGNK
jgi:hypothetical protein